MNTTIRPNDSTPLPLYQLQDNSYTVYWAPLLFATVIALSLIGILVPLWEFLFQRKQLKHQLSVLSLDDNGSEMEHVSEMPYKVRVELAALLDHPSKGRASWRELAGELGYQYEVTDRKSDGNLLHSRHVSPTSSLFNRWQYTNRATVGNLLKSLHSINRQDCANILEAEYNLMITVECLTTV